MTLNIGGGSAKLAFAMMANGNAQFIEFDGPQAGQATIGSGTMEKADTTAFSHRQNHGRLRVWRRRFG